MRPEKRIHNRTDSASPHWFVRKAGWVQGPLTIESLRHMYAAGWVQSLDAVASDAAGPWCEARACEALQGQIPRAGEPPVETDAAAADWEFASTTAACTEPVTFAMLQMLAAAGRLRPNDLVRRMPNGEWEPARKVAGIFGGQRAWCAACGRALNESGKHCRCGAPQPDYEPSLSNISLVCGGLAAVLLPVIIALVTGLAWRGIVIMDVVISDQFPYVFAVMLAPVAFLASIALVLGRITIVAIGLGRVAPKARSAATAGFWLGVATWISLLLAAVSITFFSIAYFSW